MEHRSSEPRLREPINVKFQMYELIVDQLLLPLSTLIIQINKSMIRRKLVNYYPNTLVIRTVLLSEVLTLVSI